MLTSALQAGLVAFVLALALTPLARRVAFAAGAVARPRADRWHRTEIPLLGGLGIAAATLAATLALVDLSPASQMLLAAGLAMFGVGIYDDVRPLRPATKLVLQIAVALLLAFARPELVQTAGDGFGVLVTTFWLVAVTNAINLLDNMDGLAAGVALIALAFALAVGWDQVAPDRLMLMAALAGALGGFLVYNFNPAGIFMGDGGSLFIGLVLAACALPDGSQADTPLLAVVSVPAVLLAIPILDTALVSVVRMLSRRRVSDGGRDHTSHRLVAIGLSERAAVLFLYGLAAAAGVVALIVQHTAPIVGITALISFAVALGLFAIYIAQVRVYEDGQFSTLVGRPFTPLLANLTFKRRIFEVLLDVVLIWLSYTAAFGLRFEGDADARFYEAFAQSLPLIVAVKMVGLWVAGVYGGMWRFVSIPDLLIYVRATVLASVLAVLAVTAFYRFENFSRGVFIIDSLVLFLLLVGSRLSFRLLLESIGANRAAGAPVLIYGAGKGGAMLLREVASNSALNLRAVGLLDDDPNKHGQRVLGCQVWGGLDELEQVLVRTRAEQVVVSTQAIGAERLARLRALCEARQVPVRQMSFVIE